MTCEYINYHSRKIKREIFKARHSRIHKTITSIRKIEIIELADEKAPENLSEQDMKIIKDKEGERILSKINPDAHVIALAIEGKMKSSEELADTIDKLATYGKSKVCFVIGGSLGLSDAVMQRANEKLSFSRMTFPHQLMRLVLVEQVYRAFRIVRGALS